MCTPPCWAQDIGLDPNGRRQGMRAPVSVLLVDDINKALDQLVAAGAQPSNG